MNRIILAFLTIMLPVVSFAAPVLNFSDIDSGPASGNTDGVGSGAIVTIWGNNLGSSQGTSKVYVGNVEATAIYYWKNADGDLPGGPADLYTWHKMQEIAFAVPSGAVSGANTIKVTVGGADSNTLIFTVRTGNIRFVKSAAQGGSDSNSGTWSSPWLTLHGAMGGGKAAAGDIVYSVGVGSTTGIKLGGTSAVIGTAANPVSLSVYPNTTVAVSGVVPGGGGTGSGAVVNNWWPANRHNAYVNWSKLYVTAAGNCAANGTDNNCVAFDANPYNRIVGARITGPSVYGGYGGAVSGTNSNGVMVEGGVYYGIHIHNYGYQPTACSFTYNDDACSWTSPGAGYPGIGASCTCSSCSWDSGTCTSPSGCCTVDRFQHLYYLSNRLTSNGVPYDIAWNNLEDNPILHGIHIYDMGAGFVGVMRIHHNVIKNQRGGAIDITMPTALTIYVYNNLIIYDAGTSSQGIPFRITGGSTNYIYNNTVYGWHNSSYFEATSDIVRNNVFYDTVGVAYVHSAGIPGTRSNNNCYGITAKPAWCDYSVNPNFTSAGTDFTVSGSILTSGYNTYATAPNDFYGASWASNYVIGAFQAASSGSGGGSGGAGLTAPWVH